MSIIRRTPQTESRLPASQRARGIARAILQDGRKRARPSRPGGRYEFAPKGFEVIEASLSSTGGPTTSSPLRERAEARRRKPRKAAQSTGDNVRFVRRAWNAGRPTRTSQ